MIPITRGSTGLYTQSDPARTQYTENGIYDLSACINIDISDRFRISRRRAISYTIAINAHSLRPVDSRYCLFVSGSSLNLLLPSITEYETVATVTAGHKLSCCVVDQTAYWVNGAEKGKVIDYVNYDWTASSVVSNNQTRVFYDPPIGKFLDYFNGRMYIALGKEVWYSEAYGPDIFSLGDSFLPFESEVTMVRAVAGGLYISESDKTWFLSGKNPIDFNWNVVDDYAALPYSDKKVIGSMTDGKWSPGGKLEVAFWLTNRGIMFGSADGAVINMTEEKMDLVTPAASGAMLVDGTNLVGQFI